MAQLPPSQGQRTIVFTTIGANTFVVPPFSILSIALTGGGGGGGAQTGITNGGAGGASTLTVNGVVIITGSAGSGGTSGSGGASGNNPGGPGGSAANPTADIVINGNTGTTGAQFQQGTGAPSVDPYPGAGNNNGAGGTGGEDQGSVVWGGGGGSGQYVLERFYYPPKAGEKTFIAPGMSITLTVGGGGIIGNGTSTDSPIPVQGNQGEIVVVITPPPDAKVAMVPI